MTGGLEDYLSIFPLWTVFASGQRRVTRVQVGLPPLPLRKWLLVCIWRVQGTVLFTSSIGSRSPPFHSWRLEWAWASSGAAAPSSHICAMEGGSQILSLPSLFRSETQWKPMDKSWRVGRDCLVRGSQEFCAVSSHLAFNDSLQLCGFLTSFYGCCHQRSSSRCVLLFLSGACHLLKFISPGWTLRM